MCASPREMSGPRAAATVQRRLHRATRSESPGNGGHGWPGRLSRQVQHLACQDVALYLVGAAVDHGAAGADQRRQRVECLAVEFLVAGDCALLLAGLDQQGADAVIGFAGPDFEQRDRCRQWLSGACARRSSGPSAYCDCFGLPRKRRSKPSSALAMLQPAWSWPTRFSAGTRTSSKNSAQNSGSPAGVWMGRIVMPGVRRSHSRKLMPACFLAFLSVRTSMKIWLASCASVVHIFWPLTMKCSPWASCARTASVRRPARSEPAFGSE